MQLVKVIVDRPIGYKDAYGNIYSLNYGYVPGVMGGDGEEQDVYILDHREPLETFCGQVIAIIERADDNETKWVISDKKHSIDEIYRQVEFIEKHFNSTIVLV
jgi:inorganic pyrophosphatase